MSTSTTAVLDARAQSHGLSAADAFDEAFYCSTYPDVLAAGVPPLAHFVQIGAQEGRDPNAIFDTSMYLERYPHVRGSGLDPLSHFMKIGAHEGCQPHVLFNVQYVLDQLKSVPAATPVTIYLAYLRGLLPIDVNPHPMFDGGYYRDMLRKRTGLDLPAGANALKHYLTVGYRMGIDPHPLLSENHYREVVPGLHELAMAGLRHYVEFGISEGRSPHPFVKASYHLPHDITGPGPFHPHEIPFFAELNVDRLKPARLSTSAAAALASWYQFDATEAIAQPEKPHISFIILNFNKAYLTLQTIASLALHTDLSKHEIIVLDNGSSADDFFMLSSFLPQRVRVIRLRANRFFGEGNNIAVEQAKGELVCFLNNDLCFKEGWLDHLLSEHEKHHGRAAVGPLFKFPNGTLQEFGGTVSPCGQVIQRYKHLRNYDTRTLPATEEVQYSSAACLLMSRELFLSIGGFDQRYEPVYYEDTDLCAKIRLSGASIRVVRDSVVYHVENATSSDRQATGNMGSIHDIIPVNRARFVGRWQHYLADFEQRKAEEHGKAFAARLFPPQFRNEAAWTKEPVVEARKRLALYSPYPLVVGGGERYLLSAASAWARHTGGEVSIVTPDQYSRLRVLTMLRDMEIPDFPFQCITLDQVDDKFDTSIVMGNEVLPSIRGLARNNIFHCQFPFPHTHEQVARCFSYLPDYRLVLVNSNFTKEHYLRALAVLNLPAPQIEVVNPPVPLPDKAPVSKGAGLVIVSVGRFFVGGHTKGHPELISAFKKLFKEAPHAELHLVGGLQPGAEHRQYLTSLEDSARGLPIYFHVNVEPWQLQDLYAKAHFYWHGTGLQGGNLSPEKYEHFGISIVEAMGYGCIPFALDHAGPAEIIQDGQSGILIHDPAELVLHSMKISASKTARKIGRQAWERASQFGTQNLYLLIPPARIC